MGGQNAAFRSPLAIIAIVVTSWIMVDVWAQAVNSMAIQWGGLNLSHPTHSIVLAMIVTLIFCIGYYLYREEIAEETNETGLGVVALV